MSTNIERAAEVIRPGTIMVHRDGGVVVISHRKDDDSGWWNTDGSGLADTVAADSEYWTPHNPPPLAAEGLLVTDEQARLIALREAVDALGPWHHAATPWANGWNDCMQSIRERAEAAKP